MAGRNHPRPPTDQPPPSWLVVGAIVDYHSIIGGPVTQPAMEVRNGPQQMASGDWVVWLKGKAGCVHIAACTRTEVSHG